MRYLIQVISLIVIIPFASNAQTVDVNKWATHIVDSLQKNKVDTIEYYHAYCGECEILRKPTDTLPTHQCDVGDWTEILNDIIYKQGGKSYSLTFNCGYPPIKKELKSVKSLDYFLSIVPILNRRDKYGASMQKKRKFNPMVVVDGGYEKALFYCGKVRQSIFMQEDQKTNKGWRAYFWIDKQIKLLALLEAETASNN
jgi:hypothetical protein